MLRQTLLALSRNRTLRAWFETSSHAASLTRRFIAGNSLDQAIAAAARLDSSGLLATLDHLGENVSTLAEAAQSREAILAALGAIHASALPSTVSIKLTQFGLDLGNDTCLQNTIPLAQKAAAIGSRVEIDMESSPYVDRTLALVARLRELHPCLRSVLQAYLFRTEADAREMNRLAIPVRLCKGAYNEPASVAFPRKSEVDNNYIRLARLLLDDGAYPAFATHDPRMIDAVLDHAARNNRRPADFEFQMLYGVRRDLQSQLAAQGFRVRLYVPYGVAWYPYFMRRLAERPANLFFIARNLIRS